MGIRTYAIVQQVRSDHLLKQNVLLKMKRHLGSHVKDVLGEQGMYQTHKFASRENEGAFVLMLGNLLILAPVEGFVLQVEPSERIGAKDELALSTPRRTMSCR